MVCEHLSAIENALLERGIAVGFRGRAWTENCREWAYFDAYLDTAELKRAFRLPDFVREHLHRGTHDGQERGLVCELCHDGLMGLPDPAPGKPRFPERAPRTGAWESA